MQTANIADNLAQIRNLLNEADRHFSQSENLEMVKDGFCVEAEKLAAYYLEEAYIHTLVLLEVMGLDKTYENVNVMFQKAKKENFTESAMGIEETYLVWGAALRNYVDSLAASYNVSRPNLITKDLTSIIRASLYSITDKSLFEKPPEDEPEVHKRIEGVLKCVFPDLINKPHISKSLKNFVPDTGLPSVRTLIEYKFISNEQDAKRVSDELLTDTRGYFSKDWDRFLYVVYETHRVKPENK